MILQLRVKNFLSFKDEITFQMTAAPIKERVPHLNSAPLIFWKGEKILKTTGIFGANGSGKSNLLKGIQFLVESVLGKKQEELWQNFKPGFSNPFLLNANSPKEPTSIEICFVVNHLEYRYGFEILGQSILSEWLYVKDKKERLIFQREQGKLEFKPNSIFEVFSQKNMVREDAFLLKLGFQFNEPDCIQVINYFQNYYFFDAFDITSYLHGTKLASRLQEENFKAKVLNLLQKADFSIEGVHLKKQKRNISLGNHELDQILNSFLAKQDIVTQRNIYNDQGKIIDKRDFIFSKFESEGTRKFFDVVVVCIDIFEKGGVLIFDELDTRFHPLLSRYLISLFYNPNLNPKNSQLIFTSHDVSLLDSDLLRRDQIWITEKNKFGVTKLFSLHEFKTKDGQKVRNDTSLLKNYLLGKYGGIPFLKNLDY